MIKFSKIKSFKLLKLKIMSHKHIILNIFSVSVNTKYCIIEKTVHDFKKNCLLYFK